MLEEILKCLRELVRALTEYRLDTQALDPADQGDPAILDSYCTKLISVARELDRLYKLYDDGRSILRAIAHLRSVASCQLSLTYQLATILKEARNYTENGLLCLPTGQRILHALEYNRHLFNQLEVRIENVRFYVKLLDSVAPWSSSYYGRDLLLTILSLRVRLRSTDKMIESGVKGFEQDLITKKIEFSPLRRVTSIITPCGMPAQDQQQPIECIAVYRGLHFRHDYFSEMSLLQQNLAALDQIPTFSAEARQRAGVSPGLVENPRLQAELARRAAEVEHALLSKRGEEIKQHWSGGKEADQFYSLIQRYINSYGEFETEIRDQSGTKSLYAGLGFSQIPFVSFSFNPQHSIRYAQGMKTSAEQAAQRRRTDDLGELYIYLIPLIPENVQRMNNILGLSTEMSIKHRILNEAEVTVLGGMQSAYLVGRMIIGCCGWNYFDPLEKELPDDATKISASKQEQWEQNLATTAIGVAQTEAKALGWVIRGYEKFPDITLENLMEPYFGFHPIKKKRPKESLFNEEEYNLMQREGKRTEKIMKALKGFVAAKTGTAGTMSLGSGFAQSPRSIEEYLAQQSITEPQASLINLLQRFEEGEATPEDNNCLIHALDQLRADDPNVPQPNFNEIRQGMGALRQVGQEQSPHISLTQANPLAQRLGLHVTVLALGYGGEVGLIGQIGREDGRKVYLLHFGAHYIPLWEKR